MRRQQAIELAQQRARDRPIDAPPALHVQERRIVEQLFDLVETLHCKTA
jgi:hypothetical protein